MAILYSCNKNGSCAAEKQTRNSFYSLSLRTKVHRGLESIESHVEWVVLTGWGVASLFFLTHEVSCLLILYDICVHEEVLLGFLSFLK